MTDASIQAIPTIFRGVRYRSRLEAKWAAFFDRCGWETEYEPFDLRGYIPDFLILGPRPVLVDVKPALSIEQLVARGDELDPLIRTWKRRALIVGISPSIMQHDGNLYDGPALCERCHAHDPRWTVSNPGENTHSGYDMLGVLSDEIPWGDPDEGEQFYHDNERWWCGAVFVRCEECSRFAIFHEGGSYHHSPCGHYLGGHWEPPAWTNDLRRVGVRQKPFSVREAWADAINDVQWRGRDG